MPRPYHVVDLYWGNVLYLSRSESMCRVVQNPSKNVVRFAKCTMDYFKLSFSLYEVKPK